MINLLPATSDNSFKFQISVLFIFNGLFWLFGLFVHTLITHTAVVCIGRKQYPCCCRATLPSIPPFKKEIICFCFDLFSLSLRSAVEWFSTPILVRIKNNETTKRGLLVGFHFSFPLSVSPDNTTCSSRGTNERINHDVRAFFYYRTFFAEKKSCQHK